MRLCEARVRTGAIALVEVRLRVQAVWACEGSALDSSSSESAWEGSGSSRKSGIPLGMYFSPVNVKAPESRLKSARAAIPSGVPNSSESARSRFVFEAWFNVSRNGYTL